MRAYLREGPGRQEKPIKADLKGMSEFPEDSGQSEGCSWQRYDQRLGRERGRGGGGCQGRHWHTDTFLEWGTEHACLFLSLVQFFTAA